MQYIIKYDKINGYDFIFDDNHIMTIEEEFEISE